MTRERRRPSRKRKRSGPPSRRKKSGQNEIPQPGLTERLLQEVKLHLAALEVSVHVQPAVTTNSYYLSLDNGHLKKARIADHEGKGYNYTYELGPHLKRESIPLSYNGFAYTRELFSDKDVLEFVEIIKQRKAELEERRAARLRALAEREVK